MGNVSSRAGIVVVQMITFYNLALRKYSRTSNWQYNRHVFTWYVFYTTVYSGGLLIKRSRNTTKKIHEKKQMSFTVRTWNKFHKKKRKKEKNANERRAFLSNLIFPNEKHGRTPWSCLNDANTVEHWTYSETNPERKVGVVHSYSRTRSPSIWSHYCAEKTFVPSTFWYYAG